MFKIAVTDDRYGSYIEEKNIFNELDAELIILDPENKSEFNSVISTIDALLVNLFPMDRTIIDSLQNCKIISRYGVGYDNVDVEAASRKGIWVSIVPDYSIEDVSDQALALMMGCIRKIAYKDRMIRKGKWNLHDDQKCHRMENGVLGLVGYGAIGRRFHQKTIGFGFSKVLVNDPFIQEENIRSNGAIPADLNTVLADSDYVSIHVPLDESTKKMIGEKQLAAMKKSSILINTSRGGVLDELAVTNALKSGEITGAGLDVFETEPLPEISLLRRLDNVILSDHTGWYSEESKVELKTKAAMNIIAVLRGGRPIYPVNKI